MECCPHRPSLLIEYVKDYLGDVLGMNTSLFRSRSLGAVLACDAKLNFDDNAEWRQKAIFDFRDYTQEDSREVGTSKRIHLVAWAWPLLSCPSCL